jgi:hypothetical protein
VGAGGRSGNAHLYSLGPSLRLDGDWVPFRLGQGFTGVCHEAHPSPEHVDLFLELMLMEKARCLFLRVPVSRFPLLR